MRIFLSIGFAGASLLLTLSCASTAGEREPELLQKVNAQSALPTAAPTREDRLAIEVEISDSGIQPVGSTLVRVPAPASGSGVEDLRVRAMAGDRVVTEYSIPDPRLVETEDQKWQLLPSARTFVYLPLSTEITTLSISPLPGRTRASKGGTVPVLDLAKRACSERTQVETCRRIMQMQ